MSVSLYYMAKRDYPISIQEQETCRKIVEHYVAEYPLGAICEIVYQRHKSVVAETGN